MMTDRMFELALAFKETEIWTRIDEDQMFAIPLSGGRTGYVSIMGRLGEHIALALYIGEEGLRSYHILREAVNYDGFMGYHPAIQNNRMLQMALMTEEDVPEEELRELQKYAKKHQHNLKRPNAVPVYLKCEPGLMMDSLETEQEAEDLMAALEAVIYAAQAPLIADFDICFFSGIDRYSEEIVCLEKKGDRYEQKMIPLPRIEEYTAPEGQFYDELSAARVARLPKKGTWLMSLVSLMMPSEWPQTGQVVYPTLLVVVDSESQEMIPVDSVVFYETHTSDMLNALMDTINKSGFCPERIHIRDPFTKALLRKWCGDVGIKLTMKKNIPHFDEILEECIAMHYMEEQNPAFAMEMMGQMVNHLLEFSSEELLTLPEEMREMIVSIPPKEEETLSEDQRKKLRKLKKNIREAEAPDEEALFLQALQQLIERTQSTPERNKRTNRKQGKKKKKGKRPAHKPGTCVLSVSLGTGCYRHIQLPDTMLMSDLAEIILEAFEFDNDHLYSFFMDNRLWSQQAEYADPRGEDTAYPADQYALWEMELEKGSKFKFLFDYGDEWTFQCKVLRMTDEVTETPKIIRSKGEAPEQYPSWDEEEDWDWE